MLLLLPTLLVVTAFHIIFNAPLSLIAPRHFGCFCDTVTAYYLARAATSTWPPVGALLMLLLLPTLLVVTAFHIIFNAPLSLIVPRHFGCFCDTITARGRVLG
jgi:hypothetical protein